MAPVRVARAFRMSTIAATTMLALAGCMHATTQTALAQQQNDLDSFAYGQPHYPSPQSTGDSGGAISALRNAFASAPRRVYAPAPPAYAAAPMPVAYDVAYKLDAGDKLRVVVYGQEGLTNTYAIDAGGSITMPLIGSVPARGRTPAGLGAAGGRENTPSPPCFFSPRGESGGPRPISLRAEHERRKCCRNRRRLLA